MRRKEIYETLNPQTRQGGAPGKAGGGKVAKTEIISTFAESTAAVTGQTPRSIRHDIQIARDIARDQRPRGLT